MKKIILIDIILLFICSFSSYSQLAEWVEKIAGTGNDYGLSIAVDEEGNIYVAGYFDSSTLNFNNGKSLTKSVYEDAYIAKYNNSGVCQWAEKIAGGSGGETAKSIAVDREGNIYVAGIFQSKTINFNNGKSLSKSGYVDSFIAKYNCSGVCQWAVSIAGTRDDYTSAYSIAVDREGNVYVYGIFSTSTLNFNNGKSLSSGDSWDNYVAKYNNSGVCQWAVSIAGDKDELASSIAVDREGNIYLVGDFFSPTLSFNNGKSLSNSNDKQTNNYIAKYDNSGVCQWAVSIAGDNDEFATSIAVDREGNIYVAGYYWSKILSFNNGKSLSNSNDQHTNAYIAKYDNSGICQWAEKIAGDSDDYGSCITVDGEGNIYVAGYYWSTILSFNNDKSLPHISYYDTYITKYNNSGICQWAEKISGASGENPYSITVDGVGNIYVVGIFISSILSFNNGKSLSKSGYVDSFIAKYEVISNPPIIITNNVSNITHNSAICGGEVISDGGANITARGVCWSTNQNPTIDDSKTTDGTSLGTFLSSITGLSPNTTYYVRAYATNSVGTAYGDEKCFKTLDITTLIKIFPNPTSDNIEISLTTSDCSASNLKIYDLSGRMVQDLTSKLINSNNQTMKVNLSNLSNGEYTIVLTCGNLKVSEKLIIMK